MKSRSRKSSSRRLRVEALCRRELMAGDMTNPVNPLDANNDDQVSAGDALVVINYMGRERLAAEGEAAPTFETFPDANGDDRVTASDALMIINHLGEGEEANGSLSAALTSIPGLSVRAGSSIRIEFTGNNMNATVSSSAAGLLTFSAGGASETLPIRNDLKIEASGNGNTLLFDGAIIPDDLIIDVSGSNNGVRLVNTRVGDDFIYRGGNGADGVILDNNTQIGDDAVIKVKKGDDFVVMQGVQVADDVLVYGDDGNDTLAVDGVLVGDDAIIRLGDDNDIASLANAQVHDVADVDGGRGADALGVDATNLSARRLGNDDFESVGSVLSTQDLIDQLLATAAAISEV